MNELCELHGTWSLCTTTPTPTTSPPTPQTPPEIRRYDTSPTRRCTGVRRAGERGGSNAAGGSGEVVWALGIGVVVVVVGR